MKVLHINTLERGGAARGCINLHLGLLQENVKSKVLFLDYLGNVPESENYWSFHKDEVFSLLQKRPIYAKIKDKLFTFLGISKFSQELKHKAVMKVISKKRDKKYEVFTSSLSLNQITEHPAYKEADIIHLHWVNNFLDYEEFFTNNSKPIFWTLHDMFPMTGGCSFSMECRQFEIKCTFCPQLIKAGYPEYVEKLFDYKYQNLKNNKTSITIITPSRWMGENSRKSKLLKTFPHYVISNGIETEFFHIKQRYSAKANLNIAENDIIVLFVADHIDNQRKGTHFIFPVVEELSKQTGLKNLLFVTVGAGELQLNARHKHLGLINNLEKMAQIYAAADVFICPSIQDNFPNTILESLLVGTPVIGFPSGGIPEMIEEGKSGFIAPDLSEQSLYETILKWYSQKDILSNLEIANKALANYKLEVQAKAVLELYRKVN